MSRIGSDMAGQLRTPTLLHRRLGPPVQKVQLDDAVGWMGWPGCLCWLDRIAQLMKINHPRSMHAATLAILGKDQTICTKVTQSSALGRL